MNWKAELEILKNKLALEHARHKAACEDIEEQAKKVIDYAGKDAKKHRDDITAEFKRWGKFINWVKYRWYYIGIGAVLLGLFLHYVCGI